MKCIEDEIPFDLPDGWEWVRLKSVIHFIRNGASIKQYRDAKGLPITRIETIATGAIDRNRLGYANIFEVDKYASYILKDYDILMSHINSPKHLGKCALYENKGNEKIIHGMNLLAIRTFSCSLAKYMCILFRSTVFKGFVWEHMKQAVNQASITTTSISNLLFAIPPVEEQTRIIDFFDDANKYMIEIDTDKDIIEQDISFAKSKILDLAIHGKLVPQDPNDEPASVLLERIRAEKEELIKQGKIKRNKKESVIFKGDDNSYYEKINGEVSCIDDEIPYELPDGWLWMRLENCCVKEIRRGKSPKYTEKSNILVFAQKCNTKHCEINISFAQYLDETTLKRYPSDEYMQDGDVVINSTGTGTLGRVGFYRSSDNNTGLSIVPDSHVTIIRGFNCIQSFYLYTFMKAHQSELEKKGEGSTNQKELKPITLKDMFIAIPPLSEQKRIEEAISIVFNHLSAIEKNIS